MKDKLLQRRDSNIADYNMTAGSASWYAVRDIAYENKNFYNFVCRKFRLDSITDLTQREAVTLIKNIKES